MVAELDRLYALGYRGHDPPVTKSSVPETLKKYPCLGCSEDVDATASSIANGMPPSWRRGCPDADLNRCIGIDQTFLDCDAKHAAMK
jgi:hypothetical protein